ncbi:MAG: nucleotidyltransferase domain-containing protein [Caldilineaceae bacterium]
MNAQVEQRISSAETIIEQLHQCAAQVLCDFPVDIAYLYGSVANKRPLINTSDIDIAIVLADQTRSPYAQLMLETEIQAALEDACQLSQIDVRTINQAPITVQGPIVQEGILLYSREKAQRVAFEVNVRKQYFDYLPMIERMQRAFLQHIRTKGLSHGQHKNRYVHSQ